VEPLDPALNPVLAPAIRLARDRIGVTARLVLASRLNARPALPVYRLRFESNSGSAWSCIAKIHCPQAPATESDRAAFTFAEERAAYAFLETLRDASSRWPHCLSQDERCLLLADLGEDAWHYPGNEEILEEISEVLTRLHATTIGREAEYLRIRSATLGGEIEDPRLEGPFRQAALGCQYLLDMGAALGAFDPHPITLIVDAAVEHIRHPPPLLHGFIHGDFNDRRQSVTREGRLWLFDFEHARYGHILLDPCMPMVGKPEGRVDTGRATVSSRHFPPHFLDLYRAKLETRLGIPIPPAQWETQRAAALIFSVFRCLGLLLAPAVLATLEHPPAYHLKWFLRDQTALLSEFEITRPVANAFSNLHPRIFAV